MDLLENLNLFSTDLLKRVKLMNYPPIHYEQYVHSISFRRIRSSFTDVVKSGVFLSSLFHWVNNLIFILGTITYSIAFFKNDQDSLYYGNFNGYFTFENKMVLDITCGYMLYFTFVLKVFYTQFTLQDDELSWIKIFRLFHKNIKPEDIQLNERSASKLWRATLTLDNLTKLFLYSEICVILGVYIWVYTKLPDYFKYSLVGFAILLIESVLIINVFKTFESFIFLFRIVCAYLSLRASYVVTEMNNYANAFFTKESNSEFDLYRIFKLLREHDSICVLIRKYNYFWRFYLFVIFFTMPILTGYFVFLLTFDDMNYVHRISLACIITMFVSYFYMVTVPAVRLSSKIEEAAFPLKLLNKYNLPSKIKYKIETYLTRFETKVAFNCYEMFNVISETYLDFFFVAGSILFLILQLFNGYIQYRLSLANN